MEWTQEEDHFRNMLREGVSCLNKGNPSLLWLNKSLLFLQVLSDSSTFRLGNDMRPLIVPGAVCPPIKGANVGLFTKLNWILEGTAFGRNKHSANVPGVFQRPDGGREGEQESVVLLVCAEGLPRAPGDSG